MSIKSFFLLLIFPVSLSAQTVHLDDKDIEYKDEVKVPGLNKAVLFGRAVQAVEKLVNETGEPETDSSEFEYTTHGEIRLSTPHPIIRKVNFRIRIKAEDRGYSYKIDKVTLWEKHRGKEVKEMSSEDLVDQMDESGNPAIQAEHILNAMDLNFQKLLTLLAYKIRESAKEDAANQRGR